MTVYKPARSPYFHYDFQFRGERHYGSTGCATRREAEAYERRERHKAANPDNRRPPISLDEACGLYTEHAEHQPSWPTTRYMLRDLLAGLGKARLLSEIGQRDLQVHFAKRRAGRSNATVNREIENARAVWRRAKKARYDIGEMPEWADLFLKVSASPPRELAREGEEADLFEALPDDARDVVMFALVSGWRKAEVIRLRWADLNLPMGEAITRIKGGDTVLRPLTSAMVALLANQPKVGPYVFTYVCQKNKSAYTDRKGRKHPARRKGERYPMTVTALRGRWDEAREAAEIAGLRFHDLRHTAATRMLRATGNLAAVGRALEHRNLRTTQRYAHVLADDVRAAIDAGQSRNSPERPNANRKKG